VDSMIIAVREKSGKKRSWLWDIYFICNLQIAFVYSIDFIPTVWLNGIC
jgi:hypothetical protein